MRTRPWLGALVIAGCGFAKPATAQDVPLRPFRADDGTPVMRAIPVNPPRPIPEEATEEPAPRAVPVATPIPMTPRPRAVREAEAAPPRAVPVESKKEEAPAQQPRQEAPPAGPADPGGEIRISPQGTGLPPDRAQLNLADSYYARKMYEAAAPEYQRYLDTYITGDNRQTALFRMAESYRQMGAKNNAKLAYDSLLGQFSTGDFIGPAAYRLGEIYYQDKEYSFALPLFRRAAVRLKEPAVVNAAKFYAARSMEALGQKLDARMTYEDVAQSKDNNPFREASRLSLALLYKDAGRTTDALKHIQVVASETENPALKVEATVRAGLYLLELQQTEKAAEQLRKAIQMPEAGKWKEVAQVGLLRILYDAEKYKELLDSYRSQASDFSAETKPEVLLLAANANRQLGSTAEAAKLYEQVVTEFPDTVYAKDASYEKLVAMYNAEDAKLPEAIDAYLAGTPEATKRDQVLLMKAEALFKREDFAAAAPIYQQVSGSRMLTGTFRAEALFKLGWCAMQTRDYDSAIKAFSDLINLHPTHKSLPYALVQRAIAYQTQKKLTEAERDFTDLIRKWPKSKERELALQQKALIRGQMNDNAGMAENFQILLRDYPKSAAAAQAHYWIGWAAFEAKDYKKAAQHLAEARTLDSEQFFEKASLRAMLSYYYLEDVEKTAREADLYAKQGKGKVPVEVLRWLGETYMKRNSPENAEKYLAQLATRDEVLPRDLLLLGQSRAKAQKFPAAIEAFQSYLGTVKEPPSRALGLLELAKAQISAGQYSDAEKSVDEALTLQPEGKVSGEARIVAGDIKAARAEWLDAAKTYESVAVILDDEEITPRALEKAVEAYRKIGEEEQYKKTLNRLQSRYPEYYQKKKRAQAAR